MITCQNGFHYMQLPTFTSYFEIDYAFVFVNSFSYALYMLSKHLHVNVVCIRLL